MRPPQLTWTFVGVPDRMQARTLTILTILNDLKHAVDLLLREKRRIPALLNMYSLIDICAALSNDGKEQNKEIFEACLNEYGGLSGKNVTAFDLWAARSSLVHTYSPLGRHTKPGGAKPIFYFSRPEPREEMEKAVRSKGYADFMAFHASGAGGSVRAVTVMTVNRTWFKNHRSSV